MSADGTKPLGPLDPHLINHLTTILGAPRLHFLGISDGKDIRTAGWTIGVGRIEVPGSNPVRGTDVEIVLTKGGYLVTTRRSWTRSADGSSHDSQTGRVHETPASAYRWLVDDGKGKLGPASKAAWVQACRTVPPMGDLEFEHID